MLHLEKFDLISEISKVFSTKKNVTDTVEILQNLAQKAD